MNIRIIQCDDQVQARSPFNFVKAPFAIKLFTYLKAGRKSVPPCPMMKFAVLKEEVYVDEDSFDYAFYTYGLSLYGNMPLVEPLEYKEQHKIEDFVIVIDTSMSCSGELVKRFLEETKYYSFEK